MDPLADFRLLFAYGDTMNRRLLDAASILSDDRLDAALDMGPGTLRATLAHIVIGEDVWLARWRADADFAWRSFETPPTPEDLLTIALNVARDRDAFLKTIDVARLDAVQPYRDSTGTMFRASLREQMLQGIVHSTHHRAQAVHMLKRAGGTFVEVDFMYWRRQPA